MIENKKTDFDRGYDLIKARRNPSQLNLAPHQLKALKKLIPWFEATKSSNKGGILVLPTGGGKTFTAIRFLCEGPLSKGYKVLWLAHTHHLLDQAFFSFGPKEDELHQGYEVGYIKEPKNKLNVKVVSGTKDYYRINNMEESDDVIISTLQTITAAHKKKQPNLMKFLESAEDKLFVIFDEAHHSPAPSYRKLILDLREQFSDMYLLGLTATPTYENEKRKGWLKELFPQDILYQVSLNELMSQKILAKPEFEEPKTNFKPDFDEREYEKWKSTYRDLPENVIDQLANSKSRNELIARIFAEDKERYGKTLIFADRIEQCVQLCEFLRKEGVKAGAMFSRVCKTSNGRIVGSAGENARTLERFRNGELEALVNIRMLTEGTDVPDINTIFLTRQTTSKILLTQMIGRALRGPNFKGTDKAFIVSFIDDWKQKINWAEWDPLDETLPEEEGPFTPIKKPPIDLISIDLIRHLSQVMHQHNNMELDPFLKSIPVGWYQTNFYALTDSNGEEETEEEDYAPISRLLMVFDEEKDKYEELMDDLETIDLSDYEEEDVKLEDKEEQLNNWYNQFFYESESIGFDLKINIFNIASHMAQNSKERPKFFLFKERDYHDMDYIANEYMELNAYEADIRLREEFTRTDRYWKTIYPHYDLFKQQFDACVNRILSIRREKDKIDKVFKTQPKPADTPEKEVKDRIKELDNYQCLCCGEDRKYLLEVDHINPKYFGGLDSDDNLQTLCRSCNTAKGIKEIDFHLHKTLLENPLPELPELKMPYLENAGNINEWIRFVRRTVNFFYNSSAVKSLNFEDDHEWKIELHEGNNEEWIEPHLNGLKEKIKEVRLKADINGPEMIEIYKFDTYL